VPLPLHELEKRAASLDRQKPIAVICASGYRSSIATSVLERLGFRKYANVVGGMTAWKTAQYDVTS
jgi:hydroxyacylglutathione hydrolase